MSLFDKKEKSQNELRRGIIESGLFCAAALAILLWQCFSFGWFGIGSGSEAGGTNLRSDGVPDIIISKTAADFTAGNDMTDSERLVITPDEGTRIHPGSYGSFSLWVSYNDPGNIYSLNLSCRTRYINGGNATEITDIRFADYIRTHIAFFSGIDGAGKYTGWLPPDGVAVIPSSEAQSTAATPLTVYWVWVEHYADLLDGSTEIAAADVEDITAHLHDNFSEWLYGTDSYSAWSDIPAGFDMSFAYDLADFEIGSGLDQKSICFTVDLNLN